MSKCNLGDSSPTTLIRALRQSLVLMVAAATVSGCALLYENVVPVEPDPRWFAVDYPPDRADAGRKIAVERCAACHAIDHESNSPAPGALPLRSILWSHDPDTLADDLIAGLPVGHDGMPRFDFNVVAADALIAYLERIGRRETER